MFASHQGAAPPEHVHPRQEERFETVSGVLCARVGGEERTLGAGEGMVVPPGTPHTWWIEGAEDAHVLVEFRPALNTEAFFETMYGLARDGKLGESGAPPLFQTAIISSTYEVYLPRPPVALQKALFAFVERTFSWLSQNRRTSRDYERLCATGEAFIYVAMSRLMVRRLTRS